MKNLFSFSDPKISLPDLKINKSVAKTVAVSGMTTLALLAVAGGIVWADRSQLFDYFATSYIHGMQSGTPPVIEKDGTIAPAALPILSEDSYVVDAVKKTNPAVVAITISKQVPKYVPVPDDGSNDGSGQINPFGDMFGGQNPFPGFTFNIPQQQQEQQDGTQEQDIGGGSGFFVSSNGLIVTNRHVVEDKTATYTVLTNDGKKHVATVVARDAVLDLALIKIDGSGYPYLSLGDSGSIDLGQTVIAIGNALGQFRNTVSVGVVSGLSRSITAGDDESGQSESLDNVIQTDAAINPGNSGGPLLDLNGEVIGVNVAVAQGSQSIGFALPIDTVKSVIDSVESTGKIIRPYLGLRYIQVNQDLKDKNNLTVDYGVLVRRGTADSDLAVIPGSPADKAGIVENDIILELDGVKLDDTTDFASLIRAHKVGDVVVLKVLSKGVEKTVNVTLEAAPE